MNIPIWKVVMAARQFDLTCDEIERFDQAKFNATAPHVVNSALTCELYLKALCLITTGKVPKGYDLQRLYSQQTPKVKAEIYKEYYVLHQTRPVPIEFKGVMNEKIFAALIAEIKDVFVFFSSIAAPFILLAVIQIPFYGVVFGAANAKSKFLPLAGAVLVAHVLAVAACFLFIGESFS